MHALEVEFESCHMWDVARANKSPFAFGIEPRVPFLDKAFLATSMSIDPQDKMVQCSHTSQVLYFPHAWELLSRSPWLTRHMLTKLTLTRHVLMMQHHMHVIIMPSQRMSSPHTPSQHIPSQHFSACT